MSYVNQNSVHEELARCLAEVAPNGASVGELTNKTYISVLAPRTGFIGTNVYRTGFVWFYLDEGLVAELNAAGFSPEPYKEASSLQSDKGKYKLTNLRSSDVLNHQELFRKVMDYSLARKDQQTNRTVSNA